MRAEKLFARFAYVEDRPEEDADGDASAASEEPEVARDEIIQESSPDNDAPAAATSSFFASEPAPPPPTRRPRQRCAAPAERQQTRQPTRQPTPRSRRRQPDAPADAPPAKRHVARPLMGAGERDGPGTIGYETRPEVLINTWQGMAAGARHRQIDVHHRLRRDPLVANADWYRLQSNKALRDAARADGADDLDPAWLSAKEGVADVSMVNLRRFGRHRLYRSADHPRRQQQSRSWSPSRRASNAVEAASRIDGRHLGQGRRRRARWLLLVNTAPLAAYEG